MILSYDESNTVLVVGWTQCIILVTHKKVIYSQSKSQRRGSVHIKTTHGQNSRVLGCKIFFCLENRENWNYDLKYNGVFFFFPETFWPPVFWWSISILMGVLFYRITMCPSTENKALLNGLMSGKRMYIIC